MALFVDTSVWSLAFRRDSPPNLPEVDKLREALTQGDLVCSTGMVLLELLRGAVPSKASATIQTAFASLELIEPTTADYVAGVWESRSAQLMRSSRTSCPPTATHFSPPTKTSSSPSRRWTSRSGKSPPPNSCRDPPPAGGAGGEAPARGALHRNKRQDDLCLRCSQTQVV